MAYKLTALLILCSIVGVFGQWTWGKPTMPPTTTAKTIGDTPGVLICIKNCPDLTQYDPVCGSDNQLYNNENDLKCAQACGRNVQVRNKGICPPVTTGRSTDRGRNLTRTTVPTTKSPTQLACTQACVVTNDYRFVCGTNGVTYQNESHLNCEKSCKIDVQVAKNESC